MKSSVTFLLGEVVVNLKQPLGTPELPGGADHSAGGSVSLPGSNHAGETVNWRLDPCGSTVAPGAQSRQPRESLYSCCVAFQTDFTSCEALRVGGERW